MSESPALSVTDRSARYFPAFVYVCFGLASFESGVSSGPPRQQRFTISFYLTAMLFIVFDIEIVFLYPLAVILHNLAWFGFIEFLFFVAILVVAYVYVWRKGALEWQ